jgi:hypothetical protein
MKSVLSIAWVTLFLISQAGLADPPPARECADAKTQPADAGPLADRPSKPGPHIEKIQALGANEWLDLGKPAPDPKFGLARGRTWGRKMAVAPDLRGAFLYGEGVHGGGRERGGRRYYNDDLFFYDINAHAWVCCHPGTPLDDPKLSYDKKLGVERDKDGNIIPVAVSVHGYWTPSYDTHRGLFMMVPSPASLYWKGKLGKHRPWFSGKGGHKGKDPRWGGYLSPWYWNPDTGKWEVRRIEGDAPRHNVDNVLFYSRKLNKAVNLFRGVWLYEYSTNKWEKVNQSGGGNGAYCYDPASERIYAIHAERKDPRTNHLTYYDIVKNEWVNPKAEGDAGHGMESNRAFCTFDTANNVVVFHIHGKHRIYDPATNNWTVLPVTDPLGAERHWGGSSAFYDEKLNAHFHFNARDSSTEPGHIWAWRYKAADAKKEGKSDR